MSTRRRNLKEKPDDRAIAYCNLNEDQDGFKKEFIDKEKGNATLFDNFDIFD